MTRNMYDKVSKINTHCWARNSQGTTKQLLDRCTDRVDTLFWEHELPNAFPKYQIASFLTIIETFVNRVFIVLHVHLVNKTHLTDWRCCQRNGVPVYSAVREHWHETSYRFFRQHIWFELSSHLFYKICLWSGS